MRTLLAGLIFFSMPSCIAQTPMLHDIRELYQTVSMKEESCKTLILLLKNDNETMAPVLAGYKACAKMAMANYGSNPFRKLSYFMEGRSLLNKSIRLAPENTELRFLRFSVQTKAPKVLGYNDSINQDKEFLINSFSQITDMQFKKLLLSFLMDSEYLTYNEKRKLT